MSNSKAKGLTLCTLLLSLAFATQLEGQTPAPAVVTLSPGDNIQAAVDSAPAGTTFTLLAGLYRMQSVQPKNGDIFNGQGTVILNGSTILSFQADHSGSGLWIANATATTSATGSCETGYPLCGYPQDLFIDNRLQVPASTSQNLAPGTWYFDRGNNMVYLPSNPVGHLVELGMQSFAFFGSATGVQLSYLIVEKYATPAQFGAIGGDSSGTGWIVNYVESRWNHGRGISLGSGSQILNSFIHHNGQLGITLYGTNSQAKNNEISWNNYANYDPGWEAGGSKFWSTTNLTVDSNYVHDNNGPGLWTDFNNVGTIYDGNTVVNNNGMGILHEISYNAIIRNNTVMGNGNSQTAWLWNGQIAVQNSSNVEVYGNTVQVASGGGNGIALINQNRGSGTLGPWVAANNYVHDNIITYMGAAGISGIADDTGGNTAINNQFDFNHYILLNGGSTHWQWFNVVTWPALRALGQETHGVCCN